MNQAFKKIFQIIFLSMYLFTTGFSIATAAAPQNYTVLAPLPGTTNESGGNCNSSTPGTGGCTSDLSHYLPGLFNLMIGVGAVSAFVVITIFGFEYMFTDSLTSKQNARSWVENALWGLGLIIFAYAILYTVNPHLLEGNLNITTPNVVAGGSLVAGTPCSQCTASLTADGLTVKSGTGTFASPALASDLVSLNTGLQSIGGIIITEGNPPADTQHVDSCHSNGTCVDAVPANSTPANINTFYATAQQKGLNPSYEVQTQSQADALHAAGVTIPISVNPAATGAHFHVKLQ